MKIERIPKTLSLWVFLLILIVTLTSCGFKNPQEGITVTLSSWQSNPNEKQLLAQVLKQFESQHPNIKVKHEIINDQYMDVIKTRLIGDAAPDVFYLDAFEAPLLMKYGVLEPLDSYINTQFDLTRSANLRLTQRFFHSGSILQQPSFSRSRNNSASSNLEGIAR
jgi:multiple sugar transport system substrate-binding protein